MLGPPPAELSDLIARRHARGLDLFDEVWEGTYHVAPAPHPHHGYLDGEVARVIRPYAEAVGLIETGPFNLGQPDNYRVPDHGWHRHLPQTAFVASAAIVVDVVSPDDATYEKLPFYARRGVEEVVVVEPDERCVRMLALAGAGYDEAERSALLDLDVAELQAAVHWP